MEAAKAAQAEEERLNAEAWANYEAYQTRLAEKEAMRPEREKRVESFPSASAQNFPIGDVKMACEAEWPSDYSMQAFCFNQQQTAFDTITAKRPSLDTINAAIQSDCEAEWPGDYRMQAFCLEQQMEARVALPNAGGDLPPEVATAIRSTCEAEWEGDFRMQAYCVKQQADSWRQLNR